ncbi:hypothetical protein [Burkholderia stagnalis]|uniref:hypothetical protein n=1 Tax=Burkholderia stagnalis TaxID=1503054 RepID=UPI000F5E8E26|nr:hypothetical protein [Burkholderia stagnalis]
MDLRTYFLQTKPAERKVFAEAIESSVDYLYLCSMGKRKPGPSLCQRIVKQDSRFTLAELRPDIWGDGVDDAAASDDVQPPAGIAARVT